MRVLAVLNKQGRVVSVSRSVSTDEEVQDMLAPRFGAVALDGQTVSEIEIPPQSHDLSALELHLQVDSDPKREQPKRSR